jgi:hypothetical protein
MRDESLVLMQDNSCQDSETAMGHVAKEGGEVCREVASW